MRLLSADKLKCLQRKPENIRNLCIMAHVDHGKTTLADSLLASNGIISQKMAGKLRYMDSRKDEQERGITMKSSSITLYYPTGGQEYLINLIDSPGHVDFSSEVSTAVRLCDGAIIVVDVVEGVCPQTQVALKQAWLENIKPVLVLNKIDRLILELKLTPLDAYICMSQVLEQVNAVMGRLFAADVLEKNEQSSSAGNVTGQDAVYDWSSGLEQSDDSNLYFSPTLGNVIFSSALDGWAFSILYFANLYSSKLGLDVKELVECLWGDFYLNPKTKKISPGAQEKAKKPLFVQLVLENIWTLYDTICIRKDKEKLSKIIENLSIKVATRDLRHTDVKVQLQAVCSQWLPVASSVLDMVCKQLPPANKLSEDKVEKLLCSTNRSFSSYPPRTQALKDVFLKCSSDHEAPVIVFVSKMFPMERKLLPENRPKALSTEELNARREQARLRHAEKTASESIQPMDLVGCPEDSDKFKLNEGPNPPGPDPPDEAPKTDEEQDSDVFVAFARVYSGTVRPGQTLYVLGPKHDPANALKMLEEGRDIEEGLTLKDLKGNQHITKVVVSQLYLMMGRELDLVDEVPAGNVLGLGGLEDHILKTGTLSSVLHCPSFSQLQLMAEPILRVAVEPAKLSDLPALKRGLKLLNQADACVQVLIQETGEHVLITAGEVHLERCLDDLRNRYAKVEINASEPIVPFRETVVKPPKVDMVNEAIQEENVVKKENEDSDVDAEGIVTIVTPSKQSTIRIQCVPLPAEITNLLERHSELIRTFIKKTKSDNNNIQDIIIERLAHLALNPSEDSRRISCSEDPFVERTAKALASFRNELSGLLENCSGVLRDVCVSNIWCFGPRHYGPNILLNKIKGYEGRNVWCRSSKESVLSEYDSSFVNGFQMATFAGPLCEEPMMGVAFVVHDWALDKDISSSNVYGPLSGQIMSAVKEGCRRSFQAQPQRLMAAMYSCNILANDEVLGKLYAFLGKRQGRVVHEDMAQGSAFFNISAILPVIESFNFAQAIRKQTSGLASPQLVFSHWEVIDIDPFWCPSTEEEYLHYGEKADTENRARAYMDSVRRRKGLPVQQKIVQFAEKQRTLSKKK